MPDHDILTQRERYAGQAMTGLCANLMFYDQMVKHFKGDLEAVAEAIAEAAILQADKLIEALKQPTSTPKP